jgi:hypothetical protein
MHRLSLLFVCFLCVIFSFGCVCLSTVSSPKLSNRQLVAAVSSSTVALISRSDGKHTYCSGVWIARDIILTAEHCIEGEAKFLNTAALEKALKEAGLDPEKETEEDILIALLTMEKVPDIVVPQNLRIGFIVQSEATNINVRPSDMHYGVAYQLSKMWDLALIRVDNIDVVPAHRVATLAEEAPLVGEKVVVAGHPSGLYWSYMEGIVSGYYRSLSGVGVGIAGPFMLVQGPMNHGDSGAGIFNERGEMVGIVDFLPPVPGLSFSHDLNSIKGWLQGQRLVPVVLKL